MLHSTQQPSTSHGEQQLFAELRGRELDSQSRNEPIPISELLLGTKRLNQELIISSISYCLGFFGIVITYLWCEPENKDFFDMEIFLIPMVTNGILILFNLIFAYAINCDNIYQSLFVKYMIYFFMPVHVVFQIEIIIRYANNFSPMYDSVIDNLGDYSKYFERYFLHAGLTLGSSSAVWFIIFICCGLVASRPKRQTQEEYEAEFSRLLNKLYSLFTPSYIPVFGLLLYILLFCFISFTILLLPFILCVTQFVSIFFFIPKNFILNFYHILSNYKFSY